MGKYCSSRPNHKLREFAVTYKEGFVLRKDFSYSVLLIAAAKINDFRVFIFYSRVDI